MPVAQFNLVASAYAADALARLLSEASSFYAATLYPEADPPPIERVRTFIVDIAAEHWATAGVPVSQGGKLAPYFTCITLKGRQPDQLQALMAGFTDLLVRHLGCEVGLVRGRLIEVAPDHWFIGGKSASQTRGGEIAARAKA